MNCLNFLHNKLIKETLWSFATKSVTFILFFALNIYIARMLGVEKFGLWSFFFSFFTIVFLFSNFGINASTRKFVAQYNNTDKLKNVLESSLKLRLFFSFIFSLALFISSTLLSNLIGHPEFKFLFQYSAPLIFLSTVIEYLKSVFMGLHRIKYNFIINILEYGLKLLFVIILFQFSISLLNIINAYILATFLVVFICLSILYFQFYVKSQNSDSGDFIINIFKYSIPLLFTSIGAIIALELDIIMLGLLSSNYEVGIYAVAKSIATKIPHISLALAMGTMPIFAKINDKNKNELKKKFLNILKINTGIILIIVCIILLFSNILIPLIYGVDYSSSVIPLQILTIFLINRSYLIFLNFFLDYQGLAKKRLYNSLLAMALNIILNLLLIPKYGAIGASVATSIAYTPYVILNWLEVRKILNK